jgi:hypothetical protein
MKKRSFLICIFFTVHFFAYSQQGVRRDYVPYNHLWTSLDAEHDLSERLKLGIDLPYRRQSLEKGSLQVYEHLHWYGFRLWTSYRISDKVYLNFSPLAYFYEVPPTNEPEGLAAWQDEIRFSFRLRYAPENSILAHRYGIERRFRRDHEGNHWREYRLRYLLRLNTGIYRGYRLVVADELFINMDKDIAYNIFDMNRILLGIRKEVQPDLKITIAYQNVLDLLSSGEEFNVIHILSIGVSVNSILTD